jgi:hypothetical protein
MSTCCRDVYVRSAHLWSCERVVVLGGRPVEGDTVNELIENQTLLLREYTLMARAIYKCSRQDPEAAYGWSNARARGRLQL